MKKIIITFSSILLFNYICFSQRGGTTRSFEIFGLANSNEIIDALKIGIPLLILGVFIIYLGYKPIIKSAANTIGCLGYIVLATGIIFLVPLWTWIEYIFVNILAFGTALIIFGIIVTFICSLIYYLFKTFSKNK